MKRVVKFPKIKYHKKLLYTLAATQLLESVLNILDYAFTAKMKQRVKIYWFDLSYYTLAETQLFDKELYSFSVHLENESKAIPIDVSSKITLKQFIDTIESELDFLCLSS